MSMRTACLVGVVALPVALGAASALAKPVFHSAQSEAERALARILKLDADNPGQIDPAVETAGRRPRTTPPAGATYLKYLTTPLATAILVEEARQVKANCGGVSKRGEECGMDADPIICAQDFPKSYLFQTTQSAPALVVVEAAWPPDQGAQPSRSGAYRLKLTGGVWKVDGISCAGGDTYNWPGH
jgi:hypothetical protein